MKSVQLSAIGQPLIDADLSAPGPGPNEVLINIHAAGICRSDTHYRSGIGDTGSLPLTLGHEVAGTVASIGDGVDQVAVGDRVALHYLVSCRTCHHCLAGNEQFCDNVEMIGKDRPGGFSEQIIVPQRNCVPLPDAVDFDQGAVLMCACATALHAINKARLVAGEKVVIFGVGGLGLAAVQIAFAKGASRVIAVDLIQEKLDQAAKFGAKVIDASHGNVMDGVKSLTDGIGADVALELIGHTTTITQAVQSLAPKGRAALAGITRNEIMLDTYHDIIGNEAEVIGVSDHTLEELSDLMVMVESGALDPQVLIEARVPLEAGAINAALDALEQNRAPVRTVIEVR